MALPILWMTSHLLLGREWFLNPYQWNHYALMEQFWINAITLMFIMSLILVIGYYYPKSGEQRRLNRMAKAQKGGRRRVRLFKGFWAILANKSSSVFAISWNMQKAILSDSAWLSLHLKWLYRPRTTGWIEVETGCYHLWDSFDSNRPRMAKNPLSRWGSMISRFLVSMIFQEMMKEGMVLPSDHS